MKNLDLNACGISEMNATAAQDLNGGDVLTTLLTAYFCLNSYTKIKAKKMKKFYFLALFSFISNLGNFCFSQTYTDTSFGMKIINNSIYIDSVSVNGLLLGSFLLDTGSQLTILDNNFASRLKLLNGEKTISAVDINGNVYPKKTIHIDSLKIGEFLLSNIDGFVTDLTHANEKVDGIIGANCLKDKIWLFDFPANRIHPLSSVDANDYKYQIPFKLKKGLPYVSLKIADSVFKNVLFDTGNANRLSFTIKDSVLLKTKSNENSYYLFLDQSLFENKTKILRTKESFFPSLSMNNMTIDSCYAVFLGNVRAIGIPFIQESVIVLDYLNKKLYTNGLHQKNELNFGCRFKITEQGTIIVASIRENSLATEKGLNLGDEIIKMDNLESNRLKEIIRDESIYKKLNSKTIIERENATKISIISK